MGNFNRGDRFSGKKRFDGGNSGFKKGGQSERHIMHQATCSDCGKECEVPFRPTGDKPVFCSVCFGNKDNSSKSRSERRNSERSSFGDKKMFKTTCDQCHKECEVPFRPTGDKPVFCSNCFGKSQGSGGGNNAVSSNQHKKQFEMLNNKLDNILKMLLSQPSTPSAKKIVKEEKPVIKIVKKKEVTSKKMAKKVAVKNKVAAKKVVKKLTKKRVVPKKVVNKVVAKK